MEIDKGGENLTFFFGGGRAKKGELEFGEWKYCCYICSVEINLMSKAKVIYISCLGCIREIHLDGLGCF